MVMTFEAATINLRLSSQYTPMQYAQGRSRAPDACPVFVGASFSPASGPWNHEDLLARIIHEG